MVVTRIDANSAAERAGLKPGDLVTAFADTPVRDAPDLRNKLGMLRVGDVAEMTVLREGQKLLVQATLMEPALKVLSGEQLAPVFEGAVFTNAGVFANAPGAAGESGVRVATVRGGSRAWSSGLREGDVIVSVNRKKIIGTEEFATEVGKSPSRLVLDIVRNGETIVLSIRSSESPSRRNAGR